MKLNESRDLFVLIIPNISHYQNTDLIRLIFAKKKSKKKHTIHIYYFHAKYYTIIWIPYLEYYLTVISQLWGCYCVYLKKNTVLW